MSIGIVDWCMRIGCFLFLSEDLYFLIRFNVFFIFNVKRYFLLCFILLLLFGDVEMNLGLGLCNIVFFV